MPVKVAPSFKLTLRSKELTLLLDVLYLNFKLGSNLLRSLRNNSSFPSQCAHRKNMSSIYLNQINGCNCCVLRKLVSVSSIKNTSARWCKFSSNSDS